MKHILSAAAAVLALAAVLSPGGATAQNARSFVSAQSGIDSNPCTRPLPCRTFAYAITQTNAGGEINTLDPGGYGAVTITKAISIVSGLGEAGVLVPAGGVGITVNANANAVVNLRGLVIEGAGAGMTGVQFNSGAALNILNSAFHNLTATGISFVPAAAGALFVANTSIADIGNIAVQVQAGGPAPVKAVFSRVEVHNNTYGIYLTGGAAGSFSTVNATIAESAFSGSSSVAIVSQALSGTTTSAMVRRSALFNNSQGLSAISTGAIVRVTQSAIAGNGTGWTGNLGGTVASYRDNDIDGNGGGQSAPSAIAKK